MVLRGVLIQTFLQPGGTARDHQPGGLNVPDEDVMYADGKNGDGFAVSNCLGNAGLSAEMKSIVS